MAKLSGLVWLASIIFVVVIDAARLKKEHPKLYETRMSIAPLAWGILSIVLLIFTLPIYLYSRNKYFEDFNRLPPEERGLLGTNSFLKTCISAKIIIAWAITVLFGSLLVGFVVRLSGKSADAFLHLLDMQLLMTGLYIGAFFGFAWLGAKGAQALGFREIFDLRVEGIRKTKLIVIPITISVVLAAVYLALARLREVTPETPLGTSLEQSSSMAKLAFFTFGTFLAPLFEELLYRGLFFRVILKNKGKAWAIIVTSVCFWMLHTDRYGDNLVLGSLLVFSFCITWVRFWSRSTVSAIIMHYSYNASIFLFGIIIVLVTNASLFQYSFLSYFPEKSQEAILLKTIERNPDFAPARNDLAWMYAEENRKLDEALKLIDRALKLKPNRGPLLDTKAEVLFKLGRFQEAVDIEFGVVKRFPQDDFFKKQLAKFRAAKIETEQKMKKETDVLTNHSEKRASYAQAG